MLWIIIRAFDSWWLMNFIIIIIFFIILFCFAHVVLIVCTHYMCKKQCLKYYKALMYLLKWRQWVGYITISNTLNGLVTCMSFKWLNIKSLTDKLKKESLFCSILLKSKHWTLYKKTNQGIRIELRAKHRQMIF